MAKPRYVEWLETDGLLRIEAWARDGLTQEQIASNMGIASSTLRVWIKEHPTFSAALKRGKEVVDIEVENALYKRAMGYDVTETKTETSDQGSKTTVTVKHVAPDVTAQIFWLKNRKSAEWRDRKEQEVTQAKPFEVNITMAD